MIVAVLTGCIQLGSEQGSNDRSFPPVSAKEAFDLFFFNGGVMYPEANFVGFRNKGVLNEMIIIG